MAGFAPIRWPEEIQGIVLVRLLDGVLLSRAQWVRGMLHGCVVSWDGFMRRIHSAGNLAWSSKTMLPKDFIESRCP